MFQDENFLATMTDVEKRAWQSFRNVSENFLGNNKVPDFEEIVSDMIENYERLKCLMNVKLHFLDSHLNYFPENLGDYSEEQGERFHQDLKEIEKRYQGRWNINMMADYCWLLKREIEPDRGSKRVRDPLHLRIKGSATNEKSKVFLYVIAIKKMVYDRAWSLSL